MKNNDQFRRKLIKAVLSMSPAPGLRIPALAQLGSRPRIAWQQLKIGPQCSSLLNTITAMHRKTKNISSPGPLRYLADACSNYDSRPVMQDELTDPGRQAALPQAARRRASAGTGQAGKPPPCLVQGWRCWGNSFA